MRTEDDGAVDLLVLGDGNFSFAAACAEQLLRDNIIEGDVGPSPARTYMRVGAGVDMKRLRLTATSFDTAAEVLGKYPEFSGIQARLAAFEQVTVLHEVRGLKLHRPNSRGCGVRIASSKSGCGPMNDRPHTWCTGKESSHTYARAHCATCPLTGPCPCYFVAQINAWQIPEQFGDQTFDAIAWNHPHLGVEDFRLHRFLMAHFFHSAAASLKPGGVVCVSLVRGQESRWNLEAEAARASLRPLKPLLFDDADYPGYVCKRNKNGESFKNTRTRKHVGTDMRSFTYRFVQEQPTSFTAGTAGGNGSNSGGDEAVAGVVTAAVDGSDAAGASSTPPNSTEAKPGNPASPVASGSRAIDRAAVDLPFKCQHCPRSYSSLRGVKTHTRQVHELKKYGNDWQHDKPKKLKCQYCPRAYHDKVRFSSTSLCLHQNHCRSRPFVLSNSTQLLEPNPRPPPPSLPLLGPNNQVALWQHVVSKHSHVDGDGSQLRVHKGPLTAAEEELGGAEIEYVGCPVCTQAVPATWHMDQHLEMLKPLCGMAAECKVCARVFIEHRALRQHLNFCQSGFTNREQRGLAADPNASAMATETAATNGISVCPPADSLTSVVEVTTTATVSAGVAGTVKDAAAVAAFIDTPFLSRVDYNAWVASGCSEVLDSLTATGS